jgi:hypothetical protein
MQIEPTQHLLGTGQHALELVLAGLRRRDRHQFHLRELMLADHAARVAAGGARLGAKTRRQRVRHRQFLLVEWIRGRDLSADFGGGNEPSRSLLKAYRIFIKGGQQLP